MKKNNKLEICYGKCDSCGFSGAGVMFYSLSNHPFLFECILCNPVLLEKEYESEVFNRRSGDSQVEYASDF